MNSIDVSQNNITGTLPGGECLRAECLRADTASVHSRSMGQTACQHSPRPVTVRDAAR